MQLRDNGLSFSPITIALHWIVMALLFAILGLSIFIAQSSTTVAKEGLIQVQNLLVLTLFLVSLYRFWARVTSFHPLPVGTPNPVELIASRSVATALALAMVLLPIAAWLSKGAGGELITLPGDYVLPTMISPNEGLKHIVDVLFSIGATAFAAGLLLHVFGAFKNHFVLKNPTLKRMCGKHVEL
jgi:cytochrome b561